MKNKFKYSCLILLCGAIIGTSLGILIGFIIPSGVVQDFFLLSYPLGWDPFLINLSIIKLTTGLSVEISFVSILGIFISWYFLRFYK